MPNPYIDLKNQIEQEKPSGSDNPYLNLGKNDIVGTNLPPNTKPTTFSRITQAKEDYSAAEKLSKKENSLSTIVLRTINPVNMVKSAWNLGNQIVEDPKESARQAALGLANGLTFGATDYLQRRAFINEMKKNGIDEDSAKSMAETILKPSDPELSAIRGGADFAGMVAPYAAAEKVLMTGLKYAAPKFVLQYGKTAKVLTDIGLFNTAGQIEESFKSPEERNRLARAGLDTAAALTFFTGGVLFRKLRGTAFKNPFVVQPVSNPSALSLPGETVTADSLKAGAERRIADLTKKAFLKGNEGEELSFLKKNLDNSDALYSFNTKLPKPEGMPVPDAKAAVTIKVGEEPVASGAEAGATSTGGKSITVATNDLDSLKNYIKGSGEIDYKIIKNGELGMDASGNKILARHEFNSKTGIHTIYATDETTASTLAHELGHYFDKSLTKTTSGLSRLLPNFEQNRSSIEDALGSFAVERLGGNATSVQISSEVKTITDALLSESKVLSAIRRGGEANIKPSESFADAVSQILTAGGSKEAPILTDLLKHLETMKVTKILGEGVKKELSGAKFMTSEVAEGGKRVLKTTVVAPKIKISELYIPKELEGASATIQKIEAKIQRIVNRVNDTEGGVTLVRNAESSLSRQEENIASVVQGIKDGGDTELAAKVGKFLNTRLEEARAGVKDFGNSISEKVAAVKEKGPGVVVEKEVTKKLERTPTGKVPNTEPIKLENITNDAETEKFFKDNIVPKITGKERIGKTNTEILDRSLASKLSEKDFNNILTERFGNLSEDVVKAKRLMNDRALAIVDAVAGRNVEDIPASELGQITNSMNQLVEMFEVMSGMRTELSNSFRSLGIAVAPGENDILRQVVGEIQRVIGKDVSPFEITKKLMKLRESSIVDKYFTIWYPAILSGPKTTTRNIVGTGASLVTDTLSQLFTKEGRMSFMDRMGAIVGAQKQAWQNAKAIFKGDQNIISKFHEAPPIKGEVFSGKFKVLNKVEYVGRFLDAQDAFFSTIAKEGEVAALRTGEYTYGLESKNLINKINEGVSQAFAQKITYRNAFENTAVGTVGRAMTLLKTSDNKFVKSFFTFVMPFVRTVANVTDRKIDYIPILNLARTFGDKLSTQRAQLIARNMDLKNLLIKDMMEGGMGRNEASKLAAQESDRIVSIIAQRLKHQQMGKFYMGLTVSAGTIPLAMSGAITGAGPKDKNERDTLMQQGWRPNSLIIGNMVVPYNNLGPIAGLFSMAGNISDAIRYGNADEKGVNSLFWSGIQNFMRGELDQSFMSGISGIYDALYGFKDFDQLVAEFGMNAIPVPAAWTQTLSIINPKQYEANTVLEKLQKKFGITAGLEPKLNAFGSEYSSDLIWGLTPKMLNTEDPVFNFMNENNVFVSKPNKATKIKGRNRQEREMTPEEYTRFLEATGPAIYQKLETKITSGGFKNKSQKEMKTEVTAIVSDIRDREMRKFKF